MGGLVIKKAFILANQLHEYESVARRVRSIFFLATPHRGANLATTLSKLLAVSSGARPFVQDLHPRSLATQTINDEFPRYCQQLQLFSFYETIPMYYGAGRGIIVEKDLAVLGYANERNELLNANHRNVCRYADPTDPNYSTIRNALASMIANFRDLDSNPQQFSHDDEHREQQRLLSHLLGVPETLVDDFMTFNSQRIGESCKWLIEKETFTAWQNSNTSQLYWISAKPAAGKSVLSGYVVKHLKDSALDCMFYFFADNDNLQSSTSLFLRSMASQMASAHPQILQTVVQICTREDQICQMDARTIWNKLFLEGILKVELERRQYWVLDALDQCQGDSDLIPFLLKIIDMANINILVTSRNSFETSSPFEICRANVITEEILPEDTEFDISLYLEANMKNVLRFDEEARRRTAGTILKKAAGCFLWAKLILKELQKVHMSTEVRQFLEELPCGIDGLYLHLLDSMTRAKYGKPLAKAILTWAVCCVRPLRTDELYIALQMDVKDTIGSVEDIVATCGHFLSIDKQSRVQMIHPTARDFFLRSNTTSEFAIDKKLGHKKLAMTCLQYLSGDEMQPPRHQRLSTLVEVPKRSSFVAYACNCLHEHINHASSTDDDLLLELANFLSSSNVLSWIEYLAQNSDLNRVVQTGKALKNFLQRRRKHMFTFGPEVSIIDSWGTDLIRLVGKFGKTLLSFPSSIFHAIPPFCPVESAPYQQFGSQPHGISVIGQSNTTWDECLSTIFHRQQQLSALTCSGEYFAVGASCGSITIYNNTDCQEIQALEHGEYITVLRFSQGGQKLASAGAVFIKIWDVSNWKQLWTFDIQAQCMFLVFMDNDRILLGALKNNELKNWNVDIGIPRNSENWTPNLEGQRVHGFRRPTAAAFCMNDKLLAIVYRGQDLLLRDLEKDAFYDTFARKAPDGRPLVNTTINALAFSCAPDTHLLAVSYWDGDLILLDTSDMSVKETTMGSAYILVSSPDGRTLATAGNQGDVQLFDFESLKLLYRISLDGYYIKALAFSADSRRLLDIRGSQCQIWDPMALARQDIDDGSSDTVSVSTAPQKIREMGPSDIVLITALAYHDNGDIFFCGKEDGSVWLYDSNTGQDVEKLYGLPGGVPIMSLHYNKTYLSSTDSSSRVTTHKLLRSHIGWGIGRTLLDHRAGEAVRQVLSNNDHSRFLVSTTSADSVWSGTTLGKFELLDSISRKDAPNRRWANHPTNADLLILVTDNFVHLYDWVSLTEVTANKGIPLHGANPGLRIHTVMPCFNNSMIAAAFSDSATNRPRPHVLLFHLADLSVSTKKVLEGVKYEYLADRAEFLIGTHGNRLVFLDSAGWVCSVASVKAGTTEKTDGNLMRHFFLPSDWLSNNNELLIEVTKQGDVIIVKRDEVAVVKRGLSNIE
jgi:WD40 repeat protein